MSTDNYNVEFEVKPFEPIDKGEELPTEYDNVSPLEFMQRLFHPQEHIAIVLPDSDGECSVDNILTVEQFELMYEHFTGDFERGRGAWFCVNPLKDEESRSDKNVADFRHLLIEIDSGPKGLQYANLKASGLPIAAMCDSGNKSVHALISVNARNRKEFRTRQEIVYKFLAKLGIDQSTKNPSRLSRLPGVKRGDNMQRLLALNIGAANWAEWEQTVEEVSDLPAIEGPQEVNMVLPESPSIIHGLLREQSKMALSSGSKGRKSWMLIELARCVSVGMEWQGFKCEQCKVLYLNFELKPATFNWRANLIRKARGIKDDHQLHVMHLRGKARDIEHLVRQTKKRIKNGGFRLLVLDPLYKSIGWRDENSAGHMNDFLTHVERWCTEAGASVIMTGHFPKGDMTLRQGNDRQSGSGVLARDPDTIGNFIYNKDRSAEKKTGVCEMEFSGMREDAPIEPYYIQWNYPVFDRIEGTVRVSTKRSLSLELDDMLSCLQDKFSGETSPGEWLKQYSEIYLPPGKEMRPATFRERKRKMVELGLIKVRGKTSECKCRIAPGVKKDPETGHWSQVVSVTVETE